MLLSPRTPVNRQTTRLVLLQGYNLHHLCDHDLRHIRGVRSQVLGVRAWFEQYALKGPDDACAVTAYLTGQGERRDVVRRERPQRRGLTVRCQEAS